MIRGASRRAAQRISAIVGRCVLTALRDGDLQGVQFVLLGETREAEYLEPYGFTSAPFDGAEGIVLCPMGSRDQSVAVLFGDRRYRLQGLERGEVAIYTDEGARVVLRRDQKIEVRGKDLDAELTGSAEVTAQGDVRVSAGGTAQVDATSVQVSASGSVTVDASSATVTADVVAIDSPDIQAADGATLYLVDERFFDHYTTHTHIHGLLGSDGLPPSQAFVAANYKTQKLKGS